MVKHYIKINVIPEFKQKFKIEAEMRGLNMVKYQELIVKADKPIIELMQNRRKKNAFVI
jgi:hypothetical protein